MNDVPHDSNTQPPNQPSRRSFAFRWGALTVCCALIALVWLWLLPSLADRPAVRQRIELFDSRGIDPAAMFYTEIDALDDVLERFDRYQQAHPNALWLP